MLRSTTVKRLAVAGVLLTIVGSGAASSLAGSPPPVGRPTETLVPNVRILDFRLGVHSPAGYPLRKLGSPPYLTVDKGVKLMVWTTRQGVVDHIEAPRASKLELDGEPLSAGYHAFRSTLIRNGWKPFACGNVRGIGFVRGLSFKGRSGSLTFVRWSRQGALASISSSLQPPVFGVCENQGGVPPSPK